MTPVDKYVPLIFSTVFAYGILKSSDENSWILTYAEIIVLFIDLTEVAGALIIDQRD